MSDSYRILAINPGSTSTKISVFESEREVWSTKLTHSKEELSDYDHIFDQYEFRKGVILNELQKAGFDISAFDAIVGRGGVVYPVEGGTYSIDDRLIEDLHKGVQGEHVSNLGAPIAKELSITAGCPAFIVDPVVVDEMETLARFSGHPDLPRRSIFHALNQKAVARMAAADLGRSYSDLNLIVVHLGGGISVGAHRNGRVIDVNNALNGDGPFTPERSGGLPVGDLVELCFSGKRAHNEIKRMIKGAGGIVAYLGTNDMLTVEKEIEKGNSRYDIVYSAMAYQISKEIGALSTVLEGNVDAIVLTGGIAYDRGFIDRITRRVKFISDVLVYPGEKEMEALALGALRVLLNEETAKNYNPEGKVP
ncbi:MAG: butyrate kinase [Candidatus Aegiribacteria sp.]|nr:butyrate kinase [Candidatus Aegiribacteria sp.]